MNLNLERMDPLAFSQRVNFKPHTLWYYGKSPMAHVPILENVPSTGSRLFTKTLSARQRSAGSCRKKLTEAKTLRVNSNPYISATAPRRLAKIEKTYYTRPTRMATFSYTQESGDVQSRCRLPCSCKLHKILLRSGAHTLAREAILRSFVPKIWSNTKLASSVRAYTYSFKGTNVAL